MAEFDCHACSPVIGGAVFRRRGGEWTLDAVSKAAVIAGGWGAPPQAEIVRIGSDLQGVRLNSGFMAQGEVVVTTSILVPFGRRLQLALWETTAEDHTAGLCSQSAPPNCTKYQATFDYVPRTGSAVYDIQATWEGVLAADGGPVDAAKREVYVFQNGRYVPESSPQVGLLTPEVPRGFRFVIDGTEYRIAADGRGVRTPPQGKAAPFELTLTPGDRITALSAFGFHADAVFVGEASDSEAAVGFAKRLDENSREKWSVSVHTLNVRDGLADGESLYIAAYRFAGRLDVASGRWLWKHEDLRGPYGPLELERPTLEGQALVCTEQDLFRLTGRPPAVVRFDKDTGERLQ